MQRLRLLLAAAGSAVLLSACGGGGVASPLGSSLGVVPASAAFAPAQQIRKRIYVSSGYNGVTAFEPNGSRTNTHLPDYAVGLTVGATGTIYATDVENSLVRAYLPNGEQTTPALSSSQGIDVPVGVAVDGAGKIYVANQGNDTITTYASDGTRTKPTISIAGAKGHTVQGLALDSAGKIFVCEGQSVKTFDPDGTPAGPTITGLSAAVGIAIDAAGKLYVVDAGSVKTYLPNGTRTEPTITAGLNAPTRVAVDAAGNIYVTNSGRNEVTSYDKSGARIEPTITGIKEVTAVAVNF
jgi:hypothetical protein